MAESSESSDAQATSTALSNLVLAGVSAYQLFNLSDLDYPYAFTACIISLIEGLVKTIDNFAPDNINKDVINTVHTIMELVPLPLVNIDLFNTTKDSNKLGLAHGFFMVPLLVHYAKELFGKSEENSENLEVLKNITILGNQTSLMFLSLNEDNCAFAITAIASFIAQFGSQLVEKHFNGWGPTVFALGYSVFTFMTGQSLSC